MQEGFLSPPKERPSPTLEKDQASKLLARSPGHFGKSPVKSPTPVVLTGRQSKKDERQMKIDRRKVALTKKAEINKQLHEKKERKMSKDVSKKVKAQKVGITSTTFQPNNL